MAVISSAVTQAYSKSHNSVGEFDHGEYSGDALLTGYRASYWACFAFSMVTCGVAGFGLRGLGNKGMKKE